MTKLLGTRVQHLIFFISGQKPTMPAEGVMPDSDKWHWSNIMTGELAWNKADDIWYYNNGTEIKTLSDATSETITPETTALFNADKEADENGYAYLAGKDFVLFFNEASTDTAFQTQNIYLCIANAYPGESPESNPEKWENKGTSVVISSGWLAQVFCLNETEIKAVTGYKNGNNIVNLETGEILRYDSTATEGIKPNDNTLEAGCWIVIKASKESKIDTYEGWVAVYNDITLGQSDIKALISKSGKAYSAFESGYSFILKNTSDGNKYFVTKIDSSLYSQKLNPATVLE